MSNDSGLTYKAIHPIKNVFNQLKSNIEHELVILLFLIPAFVPVTLLIFVPLFFGVVIAVFINPGLSHLGDLGGFYTDVNNLANIRWGDFFYFIAKDSNDNTTQFFFLMNLLVFIVVTYAFYKILSKINVISKYKFLIYFVASLLSFITPPIFIYVYFNVLVSAFDIISNIVTKINAQLGVLVSYIPLNNIRLVVNSNQVVFLDILLNTILWTVTCVFFHVVLGILLALLMNKEFPGRSFFRTIFILPWAIPQFVTALIWRNFIFSYDQGFLGKPVQESYTNHQLNPFQFTTLDLLALFIVLLIWIFLILIVISVLKRLKSFENSRMFISFIVCFLPLLFLMIYVPIVIYSLTNTLGITSTFGYKIIAVPSYSDNFWYLNEIWIFGRKFDFLFISAIIVNIWLGVPFMMVSFLAALQSIPQDLYEAAKIDGADSFTQFRTITFPLIKPTLFIVSLLGFVWTFNLFNVVYILSQNQNGLGQRNYYDIFVTYIYYFFNTDNNYAFASALSFVVFLMLVGFTWIYRRLLNPDKIFEGDKSTFRS